MPKFFFNFQVTPFVILFIERDGSTYLTSLLMSHPDIQAVFERFAVLKQNNASASEQLSWAKAYLTPPMIGRRKAIGFKTKLVDVLDLDGFTTLLEQKACRVIQMRRRNFVKAVVSRINARRLYEASGKWNLYNEADRMPPAVFEIGEFDRYIQEREQADGELSEYVDRLHLPKIKIEYEDLLQDRERALGAIFSFLNLRNVPVQSKTIKHTRDNLREVILNFDELRGHYAGTSYASMFDEVLVPDQSLSSGGTGLAQESLTAI